MNNDKKDELAIGGILRGSIHIPSGDADKAIIRGVGYDVTEDESGVTVALHPIHNAFVNQGLRAVLDSAYGALAANRITHIGLSGDATAVTASTTTLGTPNSIKTTANVSRTNQTVAADQTWTQADVNFAIRKIGLLTGTAPTTVVNIIGGSGTAPYNEPFTIDLTSIALWTLTMGIDVTATAS